MTLLGGVADGVHDDEMIGDVLHAVLFHHRLFKELTDGLGLALEHGGLIGDADAFEVVVGIETLRLSRLNHLLDDGPSYEVTHRFSCDQLNIPGV